MKKLIIFMVMITLTGLFTGCGKEKDSESKKEPEINVEETFSEKTYDVDLSELSSTVIYSELFNMTNYPDDYIGKWVKMSGRYNLYQLFNEDGELDPEQMYFACIVDDSSACCSQGLEFILKDNFVYPDDYPEIGDYITIGGIFETYEEDGYKYCHLTNASLL